MTTRVLGWWAALSMSAMAQQITELRTTFEVRYIAVGAVYLNGGREEGLQEGFRLTIRRVKPGEATLTAGSIGQVVITALTAHSAVASVESFTEELAVGDIAQISKEDLEALQAIQQSKTARRYAQVVTFTEGDPLEQEQHDSVPRPPSPAVNAFRGRISYEFNDIHDRLTGLDTMQNGMAIRMDATRIGGTFWNFTGYWRGRMTSNSRAPQIVTLNDLLNRTYTLGLYYNNPDSPNSIGIGRLYLPWASSLGTIDGGYFARRFARSFRVGVFAGSTPDPTAWDYKPNRQIAGAFANFETGNFETLRFTSTEGIAVTRVSWKAERQYVFTENMLSWRQKFSIYHNLEADQLVPGRLGNTESGVVISRSFLTARVQPWKWLSIDLNHNYFRTIPTFDLVLAGTGLLDKLLFTGFSGGVRMDLPYRLTIYGNVGRSSLSNDPSRTLNQMYGISMRNILGSGIRGDVRYAVFNGAYGSGSYQSVSASRDISERLRFELVAGEQKFRSTLTTGINGFFATSHVDWFLGRHYVLGGGISLFRGQQENYDQTFVNLGYRF
jgi:hypothetical protein